MVSLAIIKIALTMDKRIQILFAFAATGLVVFIVARALGFEWEADKTLPAMGCALIIYGAFLWFKNNPLK